MRKREIYLACKGDEKLRPEDPKWRGDDNDDDLRRSHAEARENSIVEIIERDDLTEAQKRSNLGRKR